MMYAIKDSNGRYVDEDSINYCEELKEWCYDSKISYKYSRKNPRNTGRYLYGSVEEANGVIDDLKNNLHKVRDIGSLEFFIEEI